jgi:hypothetical protein
MRRIGTVGAVIAVVLLTRCGEPQREYLLPLQSNSPPEAVAVPAPALPPIALSLPSPVSSPPQLERVRDIVGLLGGPHHCGNNYFLMVEYYVPKLMQLGEQAFPDYLAILTDPWSSEGEVGGVREVLSRMQINRRMFIPAVIQRLTAADVIVAEVADGMSREYVRRQMIYLLRDIGDERDAWAILPMLNQDDEDVRRVAIESLARIGGQPELEALNTWLALQNPNDRMLPYFRGLRDQLEMRLLAQPRKQF